MSNVDLGSVLITCGHCNRMTSQHVVAGHEAIVSEEFTNSAGKLKTYELTNAYRLSQCPACNKFNLLFVADQDLDDQTVLWPTLDKPLSGLPPEIDKAYKAALSVKSIDSNAFGVLTRRLLEMVCIEREAAGRTLLEQLRDLSSKGEIPGRLAAMAQQLRQLGNIGAHAGAGELTSEEVPFLNDLCRAILEYVYVGPQTIVQVQKRIDSLKGLEPTNNSSNTSLPNP